MVLGSDLLPALRGFGDSRLTDSQFVREFHGCHPKFSVCPIAEKTSRPHCGRVFSRTKKIRRGKPEDICCAVRSSGKIISFGFEGVSAIQKSIRLMQNPFDEITVPKDALVAFHVCFGLSKLLDLVPAAGTSDQSSPYKVGAPSLDNSFFDEGAVNSPCFRAGISEIAQNIVSILPCPLDLAHQRAVTGPRISI
ncbi:MAG: hypothetical protein H6Q48_4861 [Deltaproteobacteria bacterium]|nr:hypothetical protein [Deltaproteobacteria bacterium]